MLSWWGWTILVLAVAGALAVGIQMALHPILRRMASRNAMRRPRQTATVVAGLMLGTAIISASLVAGDSAAYAIRGYVYQSLGAIDESVAIDGYPYFPEEAFDEIATGVPRGTFDAAAPMAVWGGAVEVDSGLFEPDVGLVGFDPQRDAPFGPFELRGGGRASGRDLAPGTAIITAHLADELEAGVGDEITVTFTPPVDPFVPELAWLNGTAPTRNPLPFPLPTPPFPVPGPAPPLPGASVHTVPVNASATRLTVVVGWDVGATIPPLAPPEVRLLAPDGTVYRAEPGASAVAPVWINATAGPHRPIGAGNWSVAVASPGAAAAYRGVAVAFVPVYDLARLSDRVGSLRPDGGEPDLPPGAKELLDKFSQPREATLRVVAVTDGGRGGLFDFRDAIFLRLDELQGMLGRDGEVNLLKFSNPGGAESGVRHTGRAMERINATLEAYQDAHPEVAVIQALESRPIKRDFLEVADEAGKTLTGLLVFAGSLSVITGLLLILNIFTMLAEERRSELGMARAVGLRRADLVRLMLFEGSLYAMAAAAVGALLGLGLAKLLVVVLNELVQRLASDELSFPPITYRPSLDAVLVAFSVGSLLTMLTVLVASVRQSRLNVVRAIRRIEEPEHGGSVPLSLALGVPLVAAGAVMTAMGFVGVLRPGGLSNNALSFQVFGPLTGTVGLGLLLRPHLERRWLSVGLAAALGLYYALSYFLTQRYDNPDETNIVGPIRGVLLTLCAVVLVTHFEWGARALGHALARVRRLRAQAIPAVSYPLHRRFRTGMTLAMFSVVILSIGFFSIFGGLFQTDPQRQTGGFDIEGRTSLNVEDLERYDQGLLPRGAVQSAHRLEDFETEQPGFILVNGQRTGNYGDFRHHVIGYDEGFARAQGYRLLLRDPAYATDEDAYLAVLARDDAVIVSYQYSTNSRNQDLAFTVGDTLTMHLGDEELRFTIVGIQEQWARPGVWLPLETVQALFPRTAATYLWQLPDGASVERAQEVARLIERNYRDVGMEAESTVAEVLEQQQSFRQILGAMKLFLALGLVVGVLSLGIVTSRSVLERRQEIGMLRALGYTGRQVRSIFFIEVTATILVGALVGVACAILVTFGLWFSIIRDLNYPYVVPWAEIGILLGVSYVVALAATWAPIGRAGKVPPAEALRYVE